MALSIKEKIIEKCFVLPKSIIQVIYKYAESPAGVFARSSLFRFLVLKFFKDPCNANKKNSSKRYFGVTLNWPLLHYSVTEFYDIIYEVNNIKFSKNFYSDGGWKLYVAQLFCRFTKDNPLLRSKVIVYLLDLYDDVVKTGAVNGATLIFSGKWRINPIHEIATINYSGFNTYKLTQYNTSSRNTSITKPIFYIHNTIH